MISTRLLSEVLDVIQPHNLRILPTLIIYDRYEIEDEEETIVKNNRINLCELASKCKKWCIKRGYFIGTDLDKVNVWSINKRCVLNDFEVYIEDCTEFEFKATEWVHEQVKEN